jgi:hypothetical protein
MTNKRIMKVLRDQRGVALATVIFMAAAMTVLASAGAVVTIREFRAGVDDRKATEALAYAESGVDRFAQHIRSGTVTWARLKQAGCEKPAITLPTGQVTAQGQFTAEATVFNPNAVTPADRFPIPPSGGACAAGARPANPRFPLYMAITSTGSHPAAKRVVRQVVRIETTGLPVGLYANSIEASGTPQTIGISMISETKIVGRDKVQFTGTDPYYTLEDFWPGATWPAGRSGTDFIPSAGHALQGIYMKSNGSDPEFGSGPKNCTANGAGGQSLWDSDGTAVTHGPITSGCTGQVGYPPDSLFDAEDLVRTAPKPKLTEREYQALKLAAETYGIYCRIPTSGSPTCTMQGNSSSYQTTWQDGDIAPIFASGTKNFVAYFEFLGGDPLSNSNLIKWKADVWGCNNDPDLTRSALIVVRRGGASLENGADINGALLLEEGEFKYAGTVTVNGTIIAKKINVSGTSTFSLDACWVQNMPTFLLGVTPLHWAEIDR